MRRETVAPPASLASDDRGILSDTGISSEQLIALAEQEGKQVLSDFSQRLAPRAGALKLLQSGAPGAEIIKAAREWPADLIVLRARGQAVTCSAT